MTETRRIQLHLGKCIEDLDKLYNVPDLKSSKAKLLCKTAQKLFENAEQAKEQGDEEHAYVFYMKYLRVIAYVSKDAEYQRDKKYFNDLLGAKNANKAISMAETLKKSLINRYEEQKPKVDIEESQIIKQKFEENRKKAKEAASLPPIEPVSQPLGLPGPDEVTIKSEQLYALLKEGKLKIMILDVRPGGDYIESHISHPKCISVPEERVAPGQSANTLEQNLPLPSRSVWTERASMDLIVLLDWSSTSVIPGSILYLLRTILLKWDVKVHYKREAVSLYGGYEDWLLRYPMLTTNPQVTPPSQRNLMDDMLGDIDYPNWSNMMVSSKPINTVIQRSKPIPSIPGNPVVDRSSKAAAIQMYEERARNMQIILEKQEQIADTSLTLEMQRIEAEQDWEKVQVEKEKEDRDELKAMYQLREQEIMSQLMQLENKQYDMQQENQSLREQLEEYQRKEREDAERRADSIARAARHHPQDDNAADEEARILLEQKTAARELAAKRARIKQVEEQREELDRQREVLESERKRKLAEARGKKKPEYDKFKNGDFNVEGKGRTGRPRIYEDAELEKDLSQTQKKLPLTIEVTQQAVSHRLKSLGIIHIQGNWVLYELKTRDVERRLCVYRNGGGMDLLQTREEKWSIIVTHWYPRDGRRDRGGQSLKWEEELKQIAIPNWRRVALNNEEWNYLEDDEDGDTYMMSPNESPSGAAMNRSQSSPNIAKILEDEDEPVVPSFDRSTKPAAKVAPSSDFNRQRDLQPVWGDVATKMLIFVMCEKHGKKCNNVTSAVHFFLVTASEPYIEHGPHMH
ncbi:Ubiquitin carboxyl-terminal hydrolase 8 [Eumeta japonica]|uniref:Ubiquitin carboxyl-terminal hydrolase 8 n=1 Tax=Eumeta variegata TaxID=151549 RepID=A0A4C1YAU4_EUMVA|nr:Ubiquitin carboxyl-terminal hydrolase 8 [Eumeta japonica]